MRPDARVRLLIVDDSAVLRHILSRALRTEPTFEIVGEASNGQRALEFIARDVPDLVVLDVVMPVMNGLEALVEIRKTNPALPVIMFSSQTEHGASATLDALERGASGCVAKPVAGDPDAACVMTEVLIPKIKALTAAVGSASRERTGTRALARASAVGPASPAGADRANRTDRAERAPRAAPARRPMLRSTPGKPEILVIGSSTGGPKALMDVVARLPANCAVPVLIVQHMPPVFTRQLAERLDARSALSVGEARDGIVLEPGAVWVAPGDHHMEVVRDGTRAGLRLHRGPKEQGCRPAVDVLLCSVAEAYGARTLAVILTGMGQDGLIGCQRLREANAQIVVQDEATSVVWGMPGAVVREALQDAILPLGDIGQEIVRRLVSPPIRLVNNVARARP